MKMSMRCIKIERSKDWRAGSGSEKRLVPDDLAAETARHEDGVSRWEFGGDDHVRMAGRRRQFVQSVGRFLLDGVTATAHDGRLAQIVHHVGALRVKGQQAHAVPERRGDNSSVRWEAKLFDVAPANIRFLITKWITAVNYLSQFLSLSVRFLSLLLLLLLLLSGFFDQTRFTIRYKLIQHWMTR